MPTLESFRGFVLRSASTHPAWKRSVSALEMPERFSPKARMVTFLAHEQALSRHHNCVDSDHLALALLDEPAAAALLKSVGARAEAVREAIARRLARESEDAMWEPILPKSSGIQKAWEDAHVIADSRGARLIEPEHLLLALVVPTKTGVLTTTAMDLLAAG